MKPLWTHALGWLAAVAVAVLLALANPSGPVVPFSSLFAPADAR